MKKIAVIEDKMFVVSNQSIEKIANNIRHVAQTNGNNLSPELRTLVEALWQNLYYMKAHTGAKRSNWLINMMANGEEIMKIVSKDERYLFFDTMKLIQEMAGTNLANQAIGPHQNYWTSGMSEYSVLESDCFSKYYASFTLTYVATYANNGAIVLFPDHETSIYRLGTSDNAKLANWVHLYGGFNGFVAIKYYVSERMRENFRRMNKEAYCDAWGYVPCTDELRKLPYVPSCKLMKMRHFEKPTYVLRPDYPNSNQWKKATY